MSTIQSKNIKSEILQVMGLEKSSSKTGIHLGIVDALPGDVLEKSMISYANSTQTGGVSRLGFEVPPNTTNKFSSVYIKKNRGVPMDLAKKVAVGDELVANIILARQNHMAQLGRPRESRNGYGYAFQIDQSVMEALEKLSEEDKKRKLEEINSRIKKASKTLVTCGKVDGMDFDEYKTFSQFLAESVRDILTCGRIATEVIYDGHGKFHSFRPLDASTIFKASPQAENADNIRKRAVKELERLKNKRINPKKFQKDEYSWIQVINGQPRQAFTSKECLVYNFYCSTDIEYDGYPITPIDNAINSIITHLNISTHNKLYFQNGRASRGMIVIKSEDVDDSTINRIKQQFMASINNVSNSWRMPVFGIGPEDDLKWESIDTASSRDGEFQYLSDMNSRVIMTAFMISPDELPGWNYLSKGPNAQTLSESNNAYQLTAARDVGIRPLIKSFEDFLSSFILPLIDKELSEICQIRLLGLDADSPEKEAVRLQQDMSLHMTFDQALKKVEKPPVGRSLGGDYPLNQVYQAILDKFIPVGVQLEKFFGIEGASKDPKYDYCRDLYFWQQRNWLLQMKQMEQMDHQQTGHGKGQGHMQANTQGGGVNPSSMPHAKPPELQGHSGIQMPEPPSPPSPTDLDKSIGQAQDLLNKSQKPEDLMSTSRKQLADHHKKMIDYIIDGLEKDIEEATDEILQSVSKLDKK